MKDLLTSLILDQGGKIVLFVLDGLGGFRTRNRGSELFEARTPNLDSLVADGASGLQIPVGRGITPGSGAGHLALFGYDPLQYELGRGALSAAGIGFDLKPGDVAARVNFCTLDGAGAVADRRAGRISTDENARLTKKILAGLEVPAGIEIFLETEREHRALLVMRGDGLSPSIQDTDPQQVGVPPRAPFASIPEAQTTASILQGFLNQVRTILRDERANFLLLRGFDTLRPMPSFRERYRLNAYAVAGYPMYAGISRILGMDVADLQESLSDEITLVEKRFPEFDFFFIHFKRTDSAGEDGDFDRKVAAIEEADSLIPQLVALQPDVLCVTGDHSTPSQLRAHSWHPVPFAIWGPQVQVDSTERFDEEAARQGAFGQIKGKQLMTYLLAAAGRLAKYGA